MPSRPSRPQLGLFDNPVRVFSLDELTKTVRALERERPGQTADELSRAVFAELAMKRTRRAAELVAEAIRVARAQDPRAEITGSRWQASTTEVRNWALTAGFELGGDGSIPEHATLPCITRSWRRSPRATAPAVRSPPTWAARTRTLPIPSTCSKTSA